MNSPVECDWTEEDIITEYERIKDKKKVARIFSITVKQVNDILKQGCDLQWSKGTSVG